MKKTIKTLGIVILIISGYLTMAEALSVSPSVVKLSIAPGESANGSFELYNREKGEVYVEVFLQDWVLKDNERRFANPATSPNSLCNWIVFEQDNFLIPPEKRQVIRYTIDVPEDAKGGYWGLVCFRSKPLKGEHKGGIKLITQVISFVAVEVEGTVHKKLEIQEVLAEHKEVELEKDKKTYQVKLKARLKNTGNVPLFSPSPIGKFEIKDKNNEILATGELSGNMILPNEITEYVASEPFELPKGEYETIVTFDYGMPKLVGRKVILPTDTLYDWKILKKITKQKEEEVKSTQQ